jgi:hypothetical protein
MLIRMKIHVAGTFHGRVNGVNPGEIVDVDDASGARYCRLHYADAVVDRREERAVAPRGEERAAVAEDAPAEAPRRGPGRPPKASE